MLFDTHVHLDDIQFGGDPSGVIERAKRAGVGAILAIGTTLASSRACVNLAARHSSVWAAVGIQPNHCGEAEPGDWTRVIELAREPRVVAIGETGLDKYWQHVPWDVQLSFFERHVSLSFETGLPLVIHMRDCEEDMLAWFAARRSSSLYRGVMHSFTGTVGGMKRFVALGLHISFAGMLTYPKSEALRGVAALVPEERLLIETDSPYLSPHPHRSQRPNEPALLRFTAQCLADVRKVPFAAVAETATRNAQRLFGIPEPHARHSGTETG
jgi:TatD DNase family protein